MLTVFQIRLLLAVSLVASLIGCTRATENSSKIQIAVPQIMKSNSVGSQAVGDLLQHVSININGTGIANPIVYSWDGCHDCSAASAPASFDLEVPTGSNRLFQVLAVYQNSSTQNMTFYYGDVTQSLTQAIEPITLPISLMGQGVRPISGRVAGRYFNSATTGPTGIVDMLFSPPNSRPKMIISRDFILSGWFSFFMLTDVAFEYQMRATGVDLFGGPVSLDSPQFDPNSSASNFPHVVRALVPVRNERRYQNSVPVIAAADPTNFVWGAWGDISGAASLPVCKLNMGAPLSNLYLYPTTTTALNVTSLDTFSVGMQPTKSDLYSTSSPQTSVYFVGGAQGTSGTCSGANAGNQYTAWLAADRNFIDGNGNDSAAGFQVPFQTLTVNTGVDPRTLTGKVLPGVELNVDSFQIFKRVGGGNFHKDDVNCEAISAGVDGFVDAGSAVLDGAGNLSLISAITAADVAAGVSAALCPRKSGQLLVQGIFLSSDRFGGGGGVTPANNFQLSAIVPQIAVSECNLLSLQLSAAGNFNVSNPNSVSFNLTSGGFGGYTVQFYEASDTNCLSPVTATVLSSPAVSKWLRFSVSGSGSPSAPMLSATTTAFGSSITQSAAVTLGTSSSASSILLSTSSIRLSNSGDCQELAVSTLNSGSVASPSTSTSISFPTPPANVQFQDSCGVGATVLPSLAFSASDVSRIFAVKATGAVAPGSTITVSSSAPNSTASIVVNSTVAQITIDRAVAGSPGSGGALTAGMCEQVSVTRRDSSNSPVFENAPLSVNISAPNAILYSNSDSTCSSPSSNLNVTIIPSMDHVQFFMKRVADSMGSNPENLTLNAGAPGLPPASYVATFTKGILKLLTITSVTSACSASSGQFQVQRASDNAYVMSSAGNSSLTYTAGAMGMYSNATCGSAFSPANSGAAIYLKSVASCGPSYMFNFTATSGIVLESVGAASSVSVPCSYP